MVRTMRVLKDHPRTKELVPSFVKLASWAMKYQRQDGLWAVYVKRPELMQDTAGSAGIAAALAIGFHQGWLSDAARKSAEQTLAGLMPHLTPDGFLSGVAQSNKGGSALQSGNYRVIYQMAMELMGQLVAALKV
ncbi:Glycosyl Hydrolase Family 88 [Novipirellula artificiosorum]|uniref:Glycosyl Hydrolase Family 88 n=2 Tax=Novipirellula artificiosorum TaxID=2528016 RepID=A0A5C6D8Y6_9BACT|nr:Glycosyl Hydrolase Family 88 [Novipirellula artificiosorum]